MHRHEARCHARRAATDRPRRLTGVALALALYSVALGACGGEEEVKGEPWRLGNNATPGEPDVGQPPDLGQPDQAMPEPVERDPTGAACQQDSSCEGGQCLPQPQWPGGYCSQPQGTCDVTSCREQLGECAVIAGQQTCARACMTDANCRAGYACLATQTRGVNACQPVMELPPMGEADGEACVSDAQCQSGTCIPQEQGWPQGYCTRLNCRTREDCASPNGEDNRCYQNQQGPNLCVRICTQQDECREGYICQPISRDGTGFCVPGEAPAEITITEDFAAYPFPISCQAPNGAEVALPYTIQEQTTSYMITPFALDLGRIRPLRITRPDGQVTDFNTAAHSFQAATSQFFSFINPTLMPGAPQFQGQLAAGAHTYGLRANSSQLCSYLLQEQTPGTTIDLNIYLVGVPNITAQSAANNANMQAMLAAFNSIYDKAGVQVGQVRYLDVTQEQAQRYAVIRSDEVVSELAAISTRPGTTTDDALSLNIFFVRAFAMDGGAIGVSLGLPGPAGLHGTPASGVVFTSEFLGQRFQDRFSNEPVDGNAYTGIVMAHEVGHYLGLFHTSETSGQVIEPLMDTPSCPRRDFPTRCPDLNNLMFPLAGISHTEVSADQATMIQANPLTKD